MVFITVQNLVGIAAVVAYASFNILQLRLENAYLRPRNSVFGDLTHKTEGSIKATPKSTSLRGNTSYDVFNRQNRSTDSGYARFRE